MAETALITASEVITEVIPNSSGFDTALLTKRILKVQRKYIKYWLGENYYVSICAQKLAGVWTNAEDLVLYTDYLKKCLAYFVVYEALPEIRQNITNAGVMENFTEWSNQSDSKNFGFLRQQLLTDAEDWKQHAKDYIAEQQEVDSSKFSLYDNGEDEHVNKFGIITY